MLFTRYVNFASEKFEECLYSFNGAGKQRSKHESKMPLLKRSQNVNYWLELLKYICWEGRKHLLSGLQAIEQHVECVQ